MASQAVTAVKKTVTRKWLFWLLGGVGVSGVLIILVLLALIVMLAGILSSPDTGSTDGTLNVSPDVLRYKSLVEQYCKANGIPDQVNVILAIMMQESGGDGNDVMQDGAKDPTDSIINGVKEYARDYQAAQKASQNRLETAIQAYNFGYGFIDYTISQSGGYSKSTAIAFAGIHSQGKMRSNGTYAYGDQDYVPHVERYLVPTAGQGSPILASSPQVAAAIAAGEKYIGHSTYVFGGGRNPSDIAAGRFDCSSFVHYAFAQAGVNVGWTTDELVKEGHRVSFSQIRAGDLIFFDTYETNGHVGIWMGNGDGFLNCNDSHGVTISSLSNSYWKSHFKGVVVQLTQ
ncbi:MULTISPECIES: bifunctional lytic transglycosylase/C40 family peptidase [unclassified Sporolactobacillus]|uniref:bifunctional lytic transglycosylase/C40 family peptidase n=1 Tax=unclassified Sporolactobacillus TaxID=2628533 RepID=UPI0023678152|nr:bifunctional lytic transglycosylase/C40 family peptidase [Sporolactobacillus sp. CQH2019]MDD9150459.1 bifunctional lytic transglycosylase/C40 family peptidase [Sporolactobacillus sp. CQH2019]